MGILDDAIREHLELKRAHGAPDDEIKRKEVEAFGPVRQDVAPPVAEAEPVASVQPEPVAAAEPEPAYEQPTVAHDVEASFDFNTAADAGAASLEPSQVDPGPPVVEHHPHEEPHPALVDHDHIHREDEAPEPVFRAAPAAPEAPVTRTSPAPDAPGADSPAVPEAAGAESPVVPERRFAESGSESEPPAAPEPDAPLQPAPEDPYVGDPPVENPGIDEPPPRQSSAQAVEHELADPQPPSDDVLEETPEFLQDAPEHDRLWFEQKPPRDFDFGE